MKTKTAFFKIIMQYGYFVLVGIMVVSCKNTSAPPMQGGEYKTMVVTLSEGTLSNSYPAIIRGNQDIEIRPQLSGLITEVCVKEGQNVKKGQTLFIIDQVAYRAALENSLASVEVETAKVETAQLTAESKQELYEQNVVSEFDLKTALNTLKTAKASLAQAKSQELTARNNLSYTVIKSPSDGVIGTLPYKVGALVSPSINTPLTIVSDNSQMYAYFSMTENQALSLINQFGSLDKVIESMPALTLQLSNGATHQEEGHVETFSGIIDQKTGAISVRAAFSNKEGILISGGSGKVIIPQYWENSIIIPKSATFEIQNKIFTYKVVDGKTEATVVTVLAADDGKSYVVESGLKEGDTIIVEGAAMLRNGVPVIAKKENKEGGQ